MWLNQVDPGTELTPSYGTWLEVKNHLILSRLEVNKHFTRPLLEVNNDYLTLYSQALLCHPLFTKVISHNGRLFTYKSCYKKLSFLSTYLIDSLILFIH